MLTGKIAAILNEYAVVINLGSEDGVKPGMKFVATYSTGTITDPDDADVALGELSYEIARIQAVNVQKKMTACSVLEPFYDRWMSTLTLPTKEPKVDTSGPMLAGADRLKLRVGTIVVEASPEGDQGQSAKGAAK